MPPSDPVRQLILLNLQSTLQGMTDADTYHYPVPDPSCVTLDPTRNPLTQNGADLPFYLIEPTPDTRREWFQSEQIADDFSVNIIGRVDADPSDPLGKMKAWEKLAADLEVALEVDMTRNGHACDTRCMPVQPFTGVGSNVVIALVPVVIKIYRRYGRPDQP
jgi:hypothetical protein